MVHRGWSRRVPKGSVRDDPVPPSLGRRVPSHRRSHRTVGKAPWCRRLRPLDEWGQPLTHFERVVYSGPEWRWWTRVGVCPGLSLSSSWSSVGGNALPLSPASREHNSRQFTVRVLLGPCPGLCIVSKSVHQRETEETDTFRVRRKPGSSLRGRLSLGRT